MLDPRNQEAGPRPFHITAEQRKFFDKKAFLLLKILQLAPFHIFFRKKLVPLGYTIANLKNAPGKAFSCALEN